MKEDIHYKHSKAYKQNKYTAMYQQNERLHDGKHDWDA
jgi:hypothetical protein